jgi:hypothetical protein
VALDRESIYEALCTRLQTLTGLTTPCSRNWRHWADVPAEQQPALFILAGNELASGNPKLPTVWKMVPKLFLYTTHGAEDAAPRGTTQNQLLTAIEQALELQPAETTPFADSEHTSLGGLVQYCRIEGTVEKDEGLFGSQEITEIPLEILTTA